MASSSRTSRAPHGARADGPAAARLAIVLLGVALATPVMPQTPGFVPAAGDSRSCFALAAGPQEASRPEDPQSTKQPPSGEQTPPNPTEQEVADPIEQRPPSPPKDEPREPVSEREVLDLIATLEAASGRKPGGKAGAASPARLRVVLDDVTTLLVATHARETARQLEKGGKPAAEANAWFAERLAAIDTCVARKFENRGGPTAHKQALALVDKHREKLEPLVLGLERWLPAEPPPGVIEPKPGLEQRR